MAISGKKGGFAIIVATCLVVVLPVVALSDEHLFWWGSILMYLLAVPATLTPILYSIFFRWWQHFMGQVLFLNAVSLALIIDISTAYLIFGTDYPYRDQVRAVVLGVVAVASYAMVFEMFGVWIKARRGEKPRAQSEVSKDS